MHFLVGLVEMLSHNVYFRGINLQFGLLSCTHKQIYHSLCKWKDSFCFSIILRSHKHDIFPSLLSNVAVGSFLVSIPQCSQHNDEAQCLHSVIPTQAFHRCARKHWHWDGKWCHGACGSPTAPYHTHLTHSTCAWRHFSSGFISKQESWVC